MQLSTVLRSGGKTGSTLAAAGFLVCSVLAATVGGATTPEKGGALEANRLVSVVARQDGGEAVVEVQSAIPVGYRYTAYDSLNPVRIVIDFPDMEVADAKLPGNLPLGAVREVRTGTLELTSGKLGRVELLLEKETRYQISTNGTLFTVRFAPKTAATAEGKPAVAAVPPAARPEPPAQAAAAARPARTLGAAQIAASRVELPADGAIERYQSFLLSDPPRLVVDIFGVKPGFSERSYRLTEGFRQIRVGVYEEKTRFVFDAAGAALPAHSIDQGARSVVVSWAGTKPARTAVAAAPAPVAPAPAPKAAPAPSSGRSGSAVTVQDVGFRVDGGESILTVELSSAAEVIEPVADGQTVRFGIKNAEISRALRRTIDATAFPSAVRTITPYLVAERGGTQEVRFAAELKGSVPYRLQKNGNKLLFVVDNREFAQAAPARSETLRLPVTEAPRAMAAPAVQPARLTEPVALAAPERPSAPAAGTAKFYRGQKISLVFDNADVRSILQLIAEVSNLNIIASEEVKGTVTLRLLDVPWDQALALVLEIKGLGMISEGNVVRVMPLERINALDEAQLTAARSKEKLETLVTEVVNVSYTDVATVAEAAAKLLTERGKITEDKRNKQIIITDIPAIFPEIRKLVRILDLPERQVLIEARIVEATTTFTRDLGVKWGITHSSDSGGTGEISQINLGLGGSFLIPPSAAAGAAGTAGLGSGITFGRLGIDSTVLDLRISALETAGDGKVISAPRVTTVNGATATIAQGTEIPYQTVDDNGKVETEFKKAELRLTVTPEINPDGTIFLKIEASNDSRGEDVPTGIGSAPAIDTKQATTKVLIRDRETTVVGGIFVEVQRDSKDGVPGLMSVPIVGHLFKSSNKRSERRELLIFITPRILD